jgi:hypothetical protein
MVRLGDVLGSADFAGHMKKSFTNLSLGKSVDGSTGIQDIGINASFAGSMSDW